PRPTPAAPARTTLAMLPLVALSLGQQRQGLLHDIGDRAVHVACHAVCRVLEGRRAAEVDLCRPDRGAAALLLGPLRTALGLAACLARRALSLARRAIEHGREAVDLLVHAVLALAAFRAAALTSAHKLWISALASLSFSGPVFPVVTALMY